MYLTSKAEGRTRDPSEHEEIELLLESFEKQCEEIVSEVDSLAVRPFTLPSHLLLLTLFSSQANVRHTEDIVELILDSNRNSLLGLDLKVSICTLGLTSGALIAGLFGMVRSLRSSSAILTNPNSSFSQNVRQLALKPRSPCLTNLSRSSPPDSRNTPTRSPSSRPPPLLSPASSPSSDFGDFGRCARLGWAGKIVIR